MVMESTNTSPQNNEELGEQTQKQETIAGETQNLEKGGMDDLLSFAQEQTTELSNEEKLELKVNQLKEEENERVIEKTQMEKGVETAFQSGNANYLELTNPAEYEKRHQQEIENNQQEVRNIGRDKAQMSYIYGEIGSVKRGRLWSEMPNFAGGFNMAPPMTTSEYLPNMKKAFSGVLEEAIASTNEHIRLVESGERKMQMVQIDGEYFYNEKITPEVLQKYLEQEKEGLQRQIESAQLVIQKQAEGFGRSALESGDLEVAVDNLNESGILQNPDIVSQLKDKMMKLKNSGDSADKLKLRKISEKILAIQANK